MVRPGKLQLADIITIDLIERGIFGSRGLTAIGWPVLCICFDRRDLGFTLDGAG